MHKARPVQRETVRSAHECRMRQFRICGGRIESATVPEDGYFPQPPVLYHTAHWVLTSWNWADASQGTANPASPGTRRPNTRFGPTRGVRVRMDLVSIRDHEAAVRRTQHGAVRARWPITMDRVRSMASRLSLGLGPARGRARRDEPESGTGEPHKAGASGVHPFRYQSGSSPVSGSTSARPSRAVRMTPNP